MKAHPITEFPYRWIPMLVLVAVLIAVQTALLRGYAGADWLPAAIDSGTTVVWLAILAYAAGFIAGYVSLFRTDVVIVAGGSLLWLAGCYMICDIMTGIAGLAYIPFAPTIPFRLLFGIPALTAIMLWYRLNAASDADSEEPDYTAEREPRQQEFPQEETIDRITVKDRSRIHLIEAGELLCIQANGDYVTLTTAEGEYLQGSLFCINPSGLKSGRFFQRTDQIEIVCPHILPAVVRCGVGVEPDAHLFFVVEHLDQRFVRALFPVKHELDVGRHG